MSSVPDSTSESPQVTWDVATLFPLQGQWSETEYLNLTDDLMQLVELTDGHLEILEMPTTSHQQMVLKLVRQLTDFAEPRQLGTALMAPLRVQLRPGLFREPDVVFAMSSQRIQDDFWIGADLVMEVVSAGEKSRRRDLDQKRREYAEAGIAEYWIVDPLTYTISVLQLDGNHYVDAGVFAQGDRAVSRLLRGFSVSVDELLEGES